MELVELMVVKMVNGNVHFQKIVTTMFSPKCRVWADVECRVEDEEFIITAFAVSR